jgi:hypothetical protein
LLISRSLIFIHHARTGGSSVQQYLREVLPDTYYPYADPNMRDGQKAWVTHQGLEVAWHYARHLRLDPARLPALVVIRNPYSLALSGYLYLKQRWGGQVPDLEATFASYLENLRDKTPAEQAQRWAQGRYGQYTDYLLLEDAAPENLSVARFESLVEDVSSFVRERLGVKTTRQLPHVNATRHEHFSTYYGEREEALVYEMWRNAFDSGLYARHQGLDGKDD